MPYQACQKSLFDTLVDGRASAPQFAMVVLLRLTACSTSLLIGLTSRCFVPQFAIVALLRYRLQVSFAHWTSASPVSRTARGEAPSHWARASCAPPPLPSSIRNGRSASSHRPRLRRCGVPWLRTALRFVCSPLQPFGPPMCGPPLLIGLTTACFRHRRRPSCAPSSFR